MQNLDQLRAAHALSEAKNTDKSSVAKLPSMLLINGLLGALAFACEEGKGKRVAMNAAADALARHLSNPALALPELANCKTGTALGAQLAKGEALTLQRATTEALAYLSYLKRYALKEESSERGD